MPDDISPARLDLLLDGAAQPETEAERDLLDLAAMLVAGEPGALPVGLEAAIDAIPEAAPPSRLRAWLRSRRGRLTLGAAPVVAAAIVALVVVALPGEAPGPRSWTESSELAGSGSGTPTTLLSESVDPTSGKALTPPPFVETGGRPLRTRSGPGASFAERGTIADGASVDIGCTTRGSTVLGVFGESDLWNRLTDGRWVSDAFIFTGTDDPAAAPCE